MEIGIIAPVLRTIPPASYGAIENYIDLTVRALRADGHNVKVATTGDSQVDADVVSLLPGAEVRVQGNVSREFLHTRFAYEQMENLDAIIDFTSVGPLLVHPTGPHVLVYVSAGVTTTAHEQARKSIYEQCGPEITLFTSAEAHSKSMPEIAPPHVLRTGLALDDCEPATDAQALLFVGSIRPESKLEQIIDAAGATNHPFTIAGRIAGDREENYFQSTIKPKLNDNIKYIGEISGDELHEQWQSTYALIVAEPTLESTGILFLQAQSHGVPIVAPDVAFLHEYSQAGVTSRLVADIDELPSAIEAVDRFDRHAGPRYVEAHHDFAGFGNALAELARHRPS